MAEIFTSVADLVAVLERPKRLVRLVFVPPQKHGQRGFKLKSALLADGATIQGVTLEIGCAMEGFSLPSHVVLMAEINKKARAMARVDINGSPHPNLRAVCGEFQLVDAGTTHFHDTRLHAALTIAELFNDPRLDLPIARPINDMPKEFSKAMEKCGELLHIDNLGEVEEPQWQPRQFPL